MDKQNQQILQIQIKIVMKKHKQITDSKNINFGNLFLDLPNTVSCHPTALWKRCISHKLNVTHPA